MRRRPPLHAGDTMNREPSPFSADSPNEAPAATTGEHILVVDDDPSLSNMVRDLLSDAGYDAAVVSNGPDCLDHCHRRLPDLILLDIRMPGMDGYEVCRALKHDPRTAAIPIVLLSALTETEHKIRGFSLGVFDYLTKPFSNEELLARIGNILGRQRLLKKTFEASKVDTVRQMSVTLADRINNPLAGIMACCQIISKNIHNPEKVVEVLERINESVYQIYTVLLKLASAHEVKSAEYSQGIPMVDVEPPPESESPEA
ncbi:MAG TPA: response regulator [Firmicutes bacterium]|nr:response regulator [Bacillota bacterium]